MGAQCNNYEVAEAIYNQSKRFGINPAWIFSIVKNESACDPQAVRRVKAKGLMQLMDPTALAIADNLGMKQANGKSHTTSSIGKLMLENMSLNVEFGIRYFREQFYNITGQALSALRSMPGITVGLELAVAAYNAGPFAVTQHKGIPPYRETREYVSRVIQTAKNYFSAQEL